MDLKSNVHDQFWNKYRYTVVYYLGYLKIERKHAKYNAINPDPIAVGIYAILARNCKSKRILLGVNVCILKNLWRACNFEKGKSGDRICCNNLHFCKGLCWPLLFEMLFPLWSGRESKFDEKWSKCFPREFVILIIKLSPSSILTQTANHVR